MKQTNGWTEERRQRQRQAIHRWKPWTRSTGPRRVEGKTRVAQNSYRGGGRPAIRSLERVLRAQRQQIARV
jgi:hypothetical protein